MNRLPLLDVLGRDLRYALRVLRRTPAFTTTAIVTLALVIGACSAVFSLADAILLRPLPYPQPERLALVETTTTTPRGVSRGTWADGATWEAVRDHAAAVEAAVYAMGGGGANLAVGGSAVFIRQHRVSTGFFRVLGVQPLHGREFTVDEDRTGGPAVTVLGYELWQRLFRGDPTILGQSILLRGEPHTVVGVMPQHFKSVSRVDLWTPLRGSSTGEGSGTNFQIVLRLKPGATWPQVGSELTSIRAEAFRLLGSPRNVTRELGVRPMQDALTAGLREPIVMLGWAVGVVLFIACVNLAALLLARGGGRAKEIATRMALGSGRRAVIRQLMVEAVVLALVGGFLGVLVGQLALEGLKLLGGETYTEWKDVALDARVLSATVGLSLLTSLVFGLVPAVQASRLDVQAALADSGSRGIAGGSKHWPRRLLVVAEVSLGVVLLVTAGLLIRTFVSLRSLDPGFNPTGLVTASVSLQDARYTTAVGINRLFDESLRRLRATAGVESAAISLELPYERLLNRGVRFVDADPNESPMTTNASYVTPGFLATLQLPLRAGRNILETDVASAPPVVLVNETFARVYSPDRSVIGRRIRIASVEREIVGITGDVRQRPSFSVSGVTPGPLVSLPIVFVPAAQTTDGDFRTAHIWFAPVWTVRSRSTGEAAQAIRRAIGSVDPQLPLSTERSMSDVITAATASHRLLMILVAVLAGAAVLLAAIGIQGLIAHSVAERRREFGIRIALGATVGQTVRSVALGGIALGAAGAAIGGALSLAAVKLVEAFLWGGAEHHVPTYVGVAAFLFVVTAVASLAPALRIVKLDPAETLRS